MLPGEWIDPGETPAETARREIQEEASVAIELLGIAGVFGGYPHFHGFYPNGDEVAWVSIVFDARVAGGSAKPGDEETAEVRWASVDDALALDLTDPYRHILSSVRDGRAFDDAPG
jgi:8-oxo-dGTP pyrophosphatase MutT (NUDIX family)